MVFTPLPGIALNKPATAQSYTSVLFTPNKANDSDGTNNSYWEADPYPQWWMVDLQGIYDVSSIVVRNYYDIFRYYNYEIWGSLDNVTFTKIAEKTDTKPSGEVGDTYNLTNTTVRFLKVVMTKNSANEVVHISDFRVYGTESTSTHFIDASSGSEGTITPTGTSTFNNGSSQTYTVTAGTNYQVADIKVDGVSTGTLPDSTFTTTYTFSNINANHTIEAVFAPLPGIALNKPATAQSFIGEGTAPGKANDNNRTNSSYWEATPYPQWWQVDLQNFYDISAVLIRNFHESMRSYQYEIWGSLDNVSFTKIAEKKNNLPTTDAGDMYNLADTTVTARYLRVVMTNNSLNASVHISDFRVYGSLSNAYHLITASAGTGGTITPVGTAIVGNSTDKTYVIAANANFGVADVKVDGVSVGAVTTYTFSDINANHTIDATFTLLPGVALNKPTSCQSYEFSGMGPEMANDTDGSNSSYWSANPYPQWWQVDLLDNYDVTAIYIRNYYDGDARFYQYEILASTDNVNFIKIAEKTSTNPSTDAGELYNLTTTKARYIKVIMKYNSTNNSVHISDLRVFGTQDKTLNLSSVMLEGLYNGNSTMRQAQDETGAHWPTEIADHITVELHDAANYSTIIYTATDIPLSISGNASITVPGNFNGNYYVTIKHRNSLETTTALAVSFVGSTINQSFGNPANVYGGNLQMMIDGKYAIFAGDVNQDGGIDLNDMIPVDNDASNYLYGYLNTDVNGDGIIDLNDMIKIDNNSANYIGTAHP